MANEHELLRDDVALRKGGQESNEAYIASRQADIEKEARQQEKQAQATYGLLQDVDTRVAPVRRALAIWGLDADDLGRSIPIFLPSKKIIRHQVLFQFTVLAPWLMYVFFNSNLPILKTEHTNRNRMKHMSITISSQISVVHKATLFL